ncbi:MAG: ATP phosphoribosyltransferase regulatory subunit [Candidatus Dadabacteria bacterium]|nr:ATP phosphoribosyltransferase regulatory subunit [Candidatus Dadabacteria bacterium]MCY4262503.1 ATP phosphoribosyltransferase regulatory subunit [Candidatus Dadabacteria bacterium]
MNKFLILPQGVKDFGPMKAETLKRIENRLLEEFSYWGYRKVITPLFEYLDTMSVGIGGDFRHRLMKFVDPHTGEIVVLRPDITPQIGRMVATRLSDQRHPLRLCYSGRVVRYEEKGSGKEREVFQLGCELLGLNSTEGDSEIIALAIKSLNRLGFKEITLNLGHTGILDAVLQDAGEIRDELLKALAKKDQEQIRKIVEPSAIPADVKEVLFSLSDYYGEVDVLHRAARNERFSPCIKEIISVISILEEYKVECDISVDLVEVKGFEYYTGVTFEIISSEFPASLVTGGRYDGLVSRYGRSVPAAGFAIDAEALMHRAKNSDGENQVHFIIVPGSPDLRKDAIKLADWLRSSSFKVILDLNASYEDMIDSKDFFDGDGSFATYGVIKLESSSEIKLVETRTGSIREFSNLEELLTGGGL